MVKINLIKIAWSTNFADRLGYPMSPVFTEHETFEQSMDARPTLIDERSVIACYPCDICAAFAKKQGWKLILQNNIRPLYCLELPARLEDLANDE